MPDSQAPQGEADRQPMSSFSLLLCLQVTGVQQCPWYMLNPGQPSHAVSLRHTNRLCLKSRAAQVARVASPTPAPLCLMRAEGTCRLLWDLLFFVFTTGLVVYVPMLIAFYASMAQCAYLSGAALDPTPEPNVPGPSRAGVTFMTLTNAAFLVSQAACCEPRDRSDCRPGQAVAAETPHTLLEGTHDRSSSAAAAACRVCLSWDRLRVQLDILVNFVTGVVRFNTDTGLQETSYDLLDVALTYARCGWHP